MVIAPNTQVILRRSNTDGVRLLSLVRGHVRLYRQQKYEQKKVGVLINIRDNPTAYYGTNYEIQYSKTKKLITSFNDNFKKYQLTTKRSTTQLKAPSKTDQLDQELEEELKYLLESS